MQYYRFGSGDVHSPSSYMGYVMSSSKVGARSPRESPYVTVTNNGARFRLGESMVPQGPDYANEVENRYAQLGDARKHMSSVDTHTDNHFSGNRYTSGLASQIGNLGRAITNSINATSYFDTKSFPNDIIVGNKVQGSIQNNKNSSDGKSGSSCGGSCSANGDEKLMPILDPRFNLREVAKHMILLEDHLFQRGRRCQDCINKHRLTLEGFLEEAITLDVSGEHRDLINDTLVKFKDVMKEFVNNTRKNKVAGKQEDDAYCVAAQKIRVLRKPLCMKMVDFC